mgnify:FL=1
MAIKDQPLAQINWLDRELLVPNSYNPNHVAIPELKLLVISILEDGWTQPIVTLPADEEGRYQIIDGFHRWKCSADPQVLAMSEGKVPTVQTKLDPVHRQMSTIRHNRARGTHAVVKMAEIVRSIADDGIPTKEIQKRLGMESEEVARLTNRAGVNVTQRSEKFGQAWVPS